jgi:hypothetical protein
MTFRKWYLGKELQVEVVAQVWLPHQQVSPMPPLSVVSVREVSLQNMVRLAILVRQFVDLLMRIFIFLVLFLASSVHNLPPINTRIRIRNRSLYAQFQICQKIWLRI